MKKKWLLLVLILNVLTTGFSQKKINKVNLENKEQIHVLKMKNGARYLGKIVSMTSKHIVFKLDDVMGNELKLRRKDIDIVGSFTPMKEESGVLRKPFDRLQKTFPTIEFDPKLNVNDYTQQVRIISKGKTYFGRIKYIQKSGIKVSVNKKIEFFSFVNMSKISVEDWSYSDIPSPKYEFQVDSFSTENGAEPIHFDPDFDLKNRKQKQVIFLKKGDRLNGQIEKLTADSLILKMENESVLRLDRKMVEKVEVYKFGHIRKRKKGRVIYKKWKTFEEEDYILGQSRLFASQTGFGVKKGEIEYRGTEIFVNEMNFGVTDDISLGTGLFPAIAENIFTFKLDVHKGIGDFVHLSGGGQIFVNIGGIDSYGQGEGAILGYAAASFGTPAYFINVAYNRWTGLQGYSHGDVVSIGGSCKISPKFRLFGDFFFWYEEQNDDDFFFRQPTLESRPVLIFGASWFHQFDKIDFGFLFVPDTGVQRGDEAYIFPTFGYVRRF